MPKRRKRRLPSWTHPAIYASVRLAAGGFHLAGIDASLRAMRGFGERFARMPWNQKRLQRAQENLSWCFPEWDEDRVERYSVGAYQHLFCLAAEMALAPRMLTEEGYAAYVEWGEMRVAMDRLLSSRPCLLITGHCGNWELLGSTMALLGFPMHALYRPLDMKPLDRWTRRTRAKQGLKLIDKFGAAKQLPTIVERGEPVGFIADQNAGDRGLYVPYFGRLTSTYKTIGLLAMRYKASIICGHTVRLCPTGERNGPLRYRGGIVDVIDPEDWADAPDPVYYICARYRRALETMVRAAPEQYLWMHRYWKSRPRHERENTPFPARLRDKLSSLPWLDDSDVEGLVARSDYDRARLSESAVPG